MTDNSQLSFPVFPRRQDSPELFKNKIIFYTLVCRPIITRFKSFFLLKPIEKYLIHWLEFLNLILAITFKSQFILMKIKFNFRILYI